jgi:hypothetical protein
MSDTAAESLSGALGPRGRDVFSNDRAPRSAHRSRAVWRTAPRLTWTYDRALGRFAVDAKTETQGRKSPSFEPSWPPGKCGNAQSCAPGKI